MVDMTLIECEEIEGGASAGGVITGAGLALVGGAMMVAPPLAIAGFAVFEAGGLCAVLSYGN